MEKGAKTVRVWKNYRLNFFLNFSISESNERPGEKKIVIENISVTPPQKKKKKKKKPTMKTLMSETKNSAVRNTPPGADGILKIKECVLGQV